MERVKTMRRRRVVVCSISLSDGMFIQNPYKMFCLPLWLLSSIQTIYIQTQCIQCIKQTFQHIYIATVFQTIFSITIILWESPLISYKAWHFTQPNHRNIFRCIPTPLNRFPNQMECTGAPKCMNTHTHMHMCACTHTHTHSLHFTSRKLTLSKLFKRTY